MVIVVGGFILAFTASALRPRIDNNKINERLEKQQNILYAMGINANDERYSAVFVSTDEAT